MAFFYVDTATGTDSLGNGGSWAGAVAGLIYLLNTATTTPAAGDTIFYRANTSETTKDTYASTQTIISAGSKANPIKLIGVKSGTTNEGASIVASDISLRGVDQPHFEVTGSGNDLVFAASLISLGVHFTAIDRIYPSTVDNIYGFTSCVIGAADFRQAAASTHILSDCEVNGRLWLSGGNSVNHVSGGVYTGSSTYLVRTPANQKMFFSGFDLSQGSLVNLASIGSGGDGCILFRNCKLPATYALYTGTPTASFWSITLVACSVNTGARGATTSFQDFEYADYHGTVDAEATAVRTGGADDNASGGFSFALTPAVDRTLEGTQAAVVSPEMRVWLSGGSNTLTVYIANSSVSTDFNENEVWLEVLTPDSGDTAAHEINFDPATSHLLESSTAITDDTGSTWGSGGNNHQKLSVTVTAGFEGVAYARLFYAKRFASNPVTLYLDPKIAVT